MPSLVSIIIPVFNCEDSLPRTLESIRAQSYECLDVILIDDGSQDRSGDICDDVCQIDSRFSVIHQTNQGPGSARNAGLKVAKGDYIGFVDAGDYVHSQIVEMLVGQMNKGVDVVLAGIRMTDSLCEDITANVGIVHLVELSQEQLVFNLVSTTGDEVFPWSVVWNKLYRRSLIANLFFSDLICNEDQEFNLRVYLRIKKAVSIENALYYYYKSPDSIVRNPSTKPQRLYTQTLSRYRMLDFLTENDKPEYKGWMLDYLYRHMLVRRIIVRNTSVESEYNALSRDIIRNTFFEYLFNGHIYWKKKSSFILKWLRLI